MGTVSTPAEPKPTAQDEEGKEKLMELATFVLLQNDKEGESNTNECIKDTSDRFSTNIQVTPIEIDDMSSPQSPKHSENLVDESSSITSKSPQHGNAGSTKPVALSASNESEIVQVQNRVDFINELLHQFNDD